MPKAELQKCLLKYGIDYDEGDNRSRLWKLCKEHRPKSVYNVYSLLRNVCNMILRLPPYLAELNPMEQVWAAMKRHVSAWIGFKLNTVEQLVTEAVNNVTKTAWRNYIRHWNKVVDKYWSKD